MKWFVSLATAAVLSLAAYAQQGQPPGVSLEQLAAQCDLVVAGKITEAGEEKIIDLKWLPPNSDTKGRYYKVAVTKVLQFTPAGEAAGAKPAAPKEISVAAADKWDLMGKWSPVMEKDQTKVFFLRQIPKTKEYFAIEKHFFDADDATVAAAAAACNVEKWAWGKESGGLKMAMLTPAAAEVVMGGAARPPDMPNPPAHTGATIAVRNVSKKPVALNLYQPDAPLALVALRDDKGEKIGLYGPPIGGKWPAFSADATAVVPPGGIIFIGPTNKPTTGFGLSVPGEYGPYTLKASYSSKRDGKGPKGLPLWKGALEAGQVKINVQAKRYAPGEPLPP